MDLELHVVTYLYHVLTVVMINYVSFEIFVAVYMNVVTVKDRPSWKITQYKDVIKGAIVSQITSLTIVYSTAYSGADQSKHQSSASLAFITQYVRQGMRWMNSKKTPDILVE